MLPTIRNNVQTKTLTLIQINDVSGEMFISAEAIVTSMANKKGMKAAQYSRLLILNLLVHAILHAIHMEPKSRAAIIIAPVRAVLKLCGKKS